MSIGPQISRGRFVLDPAEHPTRDSTSLRVLVSAQGCTDGQAPVIYGDPFIFYEKDTVSVIYTVLSMPKGIDCQISQTTQTTLVLSEPLGNRVLWDYGGYGELFSRSRGLSVYWSDPLADMATQRVRLIAGAGACVSDLQGDRSPLTPHELRGILARVGPNGGPVDRGHGFVGEWNDAARYFGAIEAYSDNYIYHGIIASARALGVTDPSPAGTSLVLTSLRNWYLPDGQPVWYPASLFNNYHQAKLFQSAPCVAG